MFALNCLRENRTVLRLVLRLFDVERGAVKVSGVDVRHLQQKSLRENIGYLSQETVSQTIGFGTKARWKWV